MQQTTLGIHLRRAREQAGLSQTALAQRVGMSPNHICRLENGQQTNPHLSVLTTMAEVLGVSLDTLTGFGPHKEP